MITDILEKVRYERVSPAAEARLQTILAALEDFRTKLVRHARLKSEALYPRLARLEAEGEKPEPRMWRS